jgi:hypothetical protein
MGLKFAVTLQLMPRAFKACVAGSQPVIVWQQPLPIPYEPI